MTDPKHPRLHQSPALWWGLLLVGVIAAASVALAQWPRLQGWGLSALPLAIVLGIVLGNTVFPGMAARTADGVDFAKGPLLRLGIVLYGFRITFQDILSIGVAGLVIDLVMVASVFSLAVWLGVRVFGLDRKTSMLIGAGSAICGAAAVMAAEPVVRGQAHQVSVAVATVVVFGTLGMFVYPLLYPWLGFSEHAFGIYVGSTLHEVAQVVVAGKAIGDSAASSAVIVKMLRVMLLAPFLLLLSARLSAGSAHGKDKGGTGVVIPWFALCFILASGFNSLHWLPVAWVGVLVQVDTVLLAMAMAALGLRTHVGTIRQAGVRPLLLATVLFAYLMMGGWVVNKVVGAAFGLG